MKAYTTAADIKSLTVFPLIWSVVLKLTLLRKGVYSKCQSDNMLPCDDKKKKNIDVAAFSDTVQRKLVTVSSAVFDNRKRRKEKGSY